MKVVPLSPSEMRRLIQGRRERAHQELTVLPTNTCRADYEDARRRYNSLTRQLDEAVIAEERTLYFS